MTKTRQVLSLLLAAVLLIQSGCYTTRGISPETGRRLFKEKKIFTQIPLDAGMTVELSHDLEGDEVEPGSWAHRNYVKTFKKISTQVFQANGLFKSASYDVTDTPIKIEFRVDETEKGSVVMAFICGLTYLIVPASAECEYDVTAIVKDKEGKTIGVYSAKGDFRMIIELLFILWPVGWRVSLPKDTYREVLYDISSQIDADRAKFDVLLLPKDLAL